MSFLTARVVRCQDGGFRQPDRTSVSVQLLSNVSERRSWISAECAWSASGCESRDDVDDRLPVDATATEVLNTKHIYRTIPCTRRTLFASKYGIIYKPVTLFQTGSANILCFLFTKVSSCDTCSRKRSFFVTLKFFGVTYSNIFSQKGVTENVLQTFQKVSLTSVVDSIAQMFNR